MHTIGRFAPSPSGRMHLGNVLCALLAWLSARQQNGEFLLRIEDLDEMRCPRSFADLIIDDLRWLGLDWDGEIPYQSERTAVYEKYEAILREKGLLYPCFCSRAALHAASAPHLSDGRVVYAGTCRDLTPEQVAEKRRKRAPATRVRVPERTITFTDGVYGEYTETLTEECGDFIIRRSDGVFAYQLAVVVDDGLSGVTEVVRGHDLIGSTPRQIWLYELFGFTPPNFIHIPLLCDHDGRRLSKRDEDLDLGLLREKFTPEQVIGALACAAGLTDTAEPVSAKELVKAFSWEKIPKHELYLPNVFRDIEKLEIGNYRDGRTYRKGGSVCPPFLDAICTHITVGAHIVPPENRTNVALRGRTLFAPTVKLTSIIIRRCRAQQRENELRDTAMSRLRRVTDLCSRTLSDPANRLRKTR